MFRSRAGNTVEPGLDGDAITVDDESPLSSPPVIASSPAGAAIPKIYGIIKT